MVALKTTSKLQSDRLNRGWRDQPARGTNKGRGRPQLVHVDDVLARTRWSKCGESGPLAKDCPQNKELATSSETFFSGKVCDEPSAEGNSQTKPSADVTLAMNPVLTVILETNSVPKITSEEMTKPSSTSEKMM